MANELTLAVITPEREVLNEPVDSVVIPAHDGEMGILRKRAPLMCELGVGQLRYQKAGRTRRMLIDGGFAQVNENNVIVLTNRAIRAEEITESVLQSESAQAANASQGTPEEREQRSRAQRRVAIMRAMQGA